MLKSLLKRLFYLRTDATGPALREPRASSESIENAAAGLMEQARCNLVAGNHDQTQRICEQLIGLDPEEPEAWLLLGRALNGKNDHVAAKHALDQAVALGPDVAAAYYERGITYERARVFRSALRDFHRAFELNPAFTHALINQGAMHYMLGEIEQALACTERALLIEPDHVIANRNRGLRLRELGRLEAAEHALRRAVALRADDSESICGLALVLIDAGRFEEAEHCIAQVLARDAANNEAHWNLALMFLLQGNFKEGWRHYESRRFRHDALERPYRFPEWDGSPMPRGTLLIYAEQGLGDEILFSSCFAEALQRVGHGVIECEPRLEKLFRRSFPAATVQGSKMDAHPAWLDNATTISAQIAAGSLPGFLRGSWSDFPRHHGYLHADDSRIAYWRARLDELGTGLKVGIAWTGGSMKTRRRLRSVTAVDLIPLLGAAAPHFVSLQYLDCSDDLFFMRNTLQVMVHHWQEAIDDYDETAALVSALDLVISVQTAVVHLAGALGKPAWVLVPSSPEWRYMARGESIPWYPSVRLFRQQKAGDWQPVVRRAAAELGQWVAAS